MFLKFNMIFLKLNLIPPFDNQLQNAQSLEKAGTNFDETILLPDDDIVQEDNEDDGRQYNTEGADQKEDDSCSHYYRSTEISRLSHFRFTLPELRSTFSSAFSASTSLFQILSCTKIEKGSEFEKWRWWTNTDFYHSVKTI